jgi:hypothetical protein
MDMREMVDKVKKGEPLYGTSQVSSYLQGVAARNSRYSQLFIHVLPWINVVNHDQVSFMLPYPALSLDIFLGSKPVIILTVQISTAWILPNTTSKRSVNWKQSV